MRYTIDKAKVRQQAIQEAVPKLTRVGGRTVAFIRPITPVDKGKLRNSEHFVVVGPDGDVLAGESTDDNGNPVPDYGASGVVRVIVATNEGADDGQWYGVWQERGTDGQPGKAYFAQGYAAMREITDSEFRT